MRHIVAYALVLTLLLSTAFASHGTQKEQIEGLQVYLPVEITSSVSWEECGDWNGFYFLFSGNIVLCEENLALPSGAARFVFLHELGHAYLYPEGKSYERWEGNQEDAADEFAMVISIVQGRPGDLIEMARVWEKMAKEREHNEGDTHSSDQVRADRLRQMYWGYRMGYGELFDHYKETLAYWKGRFIATETARGLA